jgi:hypothetical protein
MLRHRIFELDCWLLVIEDSPEGQPDVVREHAEPLACDVLRVR